MMAKAIRALELHYPMIQFLIIIIIIVRKHRLYLGHTYIPQTTLLYILMQVEQFKLVQILYTGTHT